MIYKLSLPIKLSFVVDDNDLQIRSVDDLEYLQEKYDTDLQDIIDEYEYKLEAEESYFAHEDMDEDFFTLNNNSILQNVIDDNISDILEKLNKEVKLSSLTKEDVNEIFITIQSDFNKKPLLNGYSEKYFVNSIEMKSYDISNSSLIIELNTDRELKEKELLELKSIIDTKCIDEWGLEFEKHDLSDIIKTESMYVFVKIWDENNPIRFINI